MFIRLCKHTSKYQVLENLAELETAVKWAEFDSLLEARQYITICELEELGRELSQPGVFKEEESHIS